MKYLTHIWINIIVHKCFVLFYISKFCAKLFYRALIHDLSKLTRVEMREFVKTIAKLKGSTYGSPEYDKNLEEINKALQVHYKKNRHHPEYYNSIADMDLVDLVEMFYDWKAATKKHKDGNIIESIRINQKRFNISSDLASILKNSCGVPIETHNVCSTCFYKTSTVAGVYKCPNLQHLSDYGESNPKSCPDWKN